MSSEVIKQLSEQSTVELPVYEDVLPSENKTVASLELQQNIAYVSRIPSS